jgi:tRNA(Arg) A34 adenosine deaminase TadA
MGRINRLIERARRIAEQSTYGAFRHGAILAKGNRVLSQGWNSKDFCQFAERFYHKDDGNATRHAEIACIHNVERSILQGSTIFVVRINRTGILRMSKPCPMCQSALRHVGVEKVVYSTNNGIATMRLR